MNLDSLLKLFHNNDCETIYIKELVKNNTSKQQIYVASGDTQILNIFPIGEFKSELRPNAKKATFHASCTFYWLNDLGEKFLAPESKFILYPDYPEIRFSGFLKGCSNPPSDILNNAVAGRYLFFGVSKSAELFGYVSDANTEISNEFRSISGLEKIGILAKLAIKNNRLVVDTKSELLQKLKAIYLKGWIASKQLRAGSVITDCNGGRCGGLTLEAELGIIQNGRSEPDYLGWEIKQFAVRKMHLVNSSRITLMTPEPDGGFYRDFGGIDFVRKYGYQSLKSPERMDFTGNHKHGVIQNKSKLTLLINGFDFEKEIITEANGGIYIVDSNGNIAASWSFAKMLTHWNKKHAKASYIPSLLKTDPVRQYKYSNKILLGEGTDFTFFLKAVAAGTIFYDPGIHIDNISIKPVLKPRSQFRISSRYISGLYKAIEIVDLTDI